MGASRRKTCADDVLGGWLETLDVALCAAGAGEMLVALELLDQIRAQAEREGIAAYLYPPTLTCHASTSTLRVRTFLSWVVKCTDGLEGRALAGLEWCMYQDGVGEAGHFLLDKGMCMKTRFAMLMP